MPVTITVRDVPIDARNAIAARAAAKGQSMQEYLRAFLIETAARPDRHEVIERARARVRALGSKVTVESILEAKDADRR